MTRNIFNLDLIESDFSENLSLSIRANAASLSEHRFFRMFKHSTGITSHQSVINQRFERAKELLQKPGMTVTEIAYLHGFSPPRISRTFSPQNRSDAERAALKFYNNRFSFLSLIRIK